MLEVLEDRRLLSASLVKGTLTITGTPSADTISIAPKSTKLVVRQSGVSPKSFTLAKVKHIKVNGGAGNDTISVNSRVRINAVLNGEAGNDVLSGGGGADTLDGGVGADSFDGGVGIDTVTYASRTRTVNVKFDNSAVSGEAGEGDRVPDTIEAVLLGKGNDTVDASSAAVGVFVSGGKGNDSLKGGNFNDTLWGFDGNDTLDGGAGADDMAGSDGADTVTYASRTTNLSLSLDGKANDGAAGEADKLDDTIDTLIGGSGNDTISGNPGPSGWLFVGGAGNDSLTAGANADDSLQGGDGNDILVGGLGKNSLDGGNGNDSLFGGAGADVLVGGAGIDTIRGDTGNDTINAKDGAKDIVDGGTGTDIATVDSTDTKTAIP
jgi:Ca2+-binding RTX toxin-like protein